MNVMVQHMSPLTVACSSTTVADLPVGNPDVPVCCLGVRNTTTQLPFLDDVSELNTKAQQWAEHLAKHGKFEHSPADQRKGIGENIAAHSNLISGDEVVEMWYSEIKDYNFGKPDFNMKTSHFTQVVWKESEQVGVGVSSQKGPNGMYVYVANYKPAGNMMGAFDKNVLPKAK